MNETIVMIHGMWSGPWCWNNYRTFFTGNGYHCECPALPFSRYLSCSGYLGIREQNHTSPVCPEGSTEVS